MSKMLEAALDYAERRWAVFPAPPGTKQSYKSERVYGTKWGKTCSAAQIKRDWAKWPNANIGLPCGPDSGFWVLEIDTPNGHGVDGFASLEALTLDHGPLPLTLKAESPSGSVHYYWAWPEGIHIGGGTTSRLGAGIDTKGDGGMVIAPPSVRADGVYRWLNETPIVHAPTWLVEMVCGTCRHLDAPDYLAKANSGLGVSDKPEDNVTPPTEEQVYAALAVLDPNCDYDTWMRIGAACKDFEDLFVEWSSGGDDFPGEDDCRKRAANFATMKDINIGTLFRMANEANPDWRKEAGCG